MHRRHYSRRDLPVRLCSRTCGTGVPSIMVSELLPPHPNVRRRHTESNKRRGAACFASTSTAGGPRCNTRVALKPTDFIDYAKCSPESNYSTRESTRHRGGPVPPLLAQNGRLSARSGLGWVSVLLFLSERNSRTDSFS